MYSQTFARTMPRGSRVAHRIVWRRAARDDLLSLYDWIADQAGAEVALDFTAKIEAAAETLSDFPNRGTSRYDLLSGLRTLTYRRRTTIAYRVERDIVEILRLSHGGRDLGGLFDVGED